MTLHTLLWIGIALFPVAFIYGVVGRFIGTYDPRAVFRVFK